MNSAIIRLLLVAAIITAWIYRCSGDDEDAFNGGYISSTEDTYVNENMNVPVIREFLAVVKKRCQIYFTKDILDFKDRAFQTCKQETGHDYKVRSNPAVYVSNSSYANLEYDKDKCWHQCVANKLYEWTGRTKKALILKTNSAKQIQNLFNPEMSEFMKIESINIFRKCRTEAMKYLHGETEKKFNKMGVLIAIPESHPSHDCYLAHSFWFCIHGGFSKANRDEPMLLNENRTIFRRCVNALKQTEIHSEGPPFQ